MEKKIIPPTKNWKKVPVTFWYFFWTFFIVLSKSSSVQIALGKVLNFIFSDPQKMHAMRTQTDRAPRDLNEIASDQNVVKIMVFYFPKIYGFPMLRSTQDDEKSILLSWNC